MPRLAALAASALCLSACSRDLAVPGANQLALEADATTVAPRERVALRASGGAGGYRFAFAAGGKLSGGKAALAATADPAVVEYQAGEAGSAQDEIEVTDGAGATARARVAVSARLAVAPSVSVVAPGGPVPLAVTGGKPPYAFTLVPDADPASDATVSPSGDYTAGAVGDAVDHVVVSDATGDPDAEDVAEVHVGAALDVYPRAISVAPFETVDFLAFGGAGSYRFAIGVAGSGGPTVGALTGAYRAGGNPSGSAGTDTVVVTDANGRTATATITVGARLRLSLAVTEFRPGVTVRMVATGGKAPYVYGFAEKGNRTGGRVDGASGDYTPGYDVGASDVLQVTDATLTSVQLGFEPRPEAVRVFPGESTVGCLAHQLDAAGTDAVLVSRSTMSFLAAEDISLGGDAVPIQQGYPGWPAFSWAVAAETDGDTAQELLLGSSAGLREMDRGVDGAFDPGALVTGYGGRPAALARPYSGAPKSYQRDLYVAEACTTGGGQPGIRRYAWADHAVAPACEQISGTPLAAVPLGSIQGLVAADLDGNGYEDLAWFTSPSGPLYVGYRSSTGFTSLATVTFPASTFASSDASMFRAVPIPGSAAQAVAMILEDLSGATGRRKVWFAYGATPAWTPWSPYDPSPAGAAPVGIVAYRPTSSANPQYLTWTGVDGVLSGFTLDPSVTSAPVPVAVLGREAPFPLTCVAPFRAFVGGAADLYLGSRYASAADIFYGDGDGRFGRRARFLVQQPVWMGDVDGDGLDDAVTATGTPGLRILYGGAEQLAHGPETATPTRANVLGVGDFTGSGRASILYQDELGDAWHAATADDGTPLPPTKVTLYNVDGTVRTNRISRWVAEDLGGEAPGVDLFQDDLTSFGATLDAWIRYDPAAIVRVAVPAQPAGADRCRAEPLAAAAGGPPGAVLLCKHFDGTMRLRAWFSALTGSGRDRSFGAWTQLDDADKTSTGDVIPLVAGLWGGRAWFAADVPGPSGSLPWLLEVTPGNPLPTARWAPLSGKLTAAFVGDVDGDGQADVVTAYGSAMTRFLGQDGAWAPAGTARTLGWFVAMPRLGGAGASPAVLYTGAALDPATFAIPVPASAFE
jgi:hypothetical protein